jgi:hypothetical protein
MSLRKFVVERADGVFLWDRIVVSDLLRGLRNLDSISELQQRLDALPRDLEFLCDHLIKRIEPVYLPCVSKVFQINRAFYGIKEKTLPKTAIRPRKDFKFAARRDNDRLTLPELYVAAGLDSECFHSMPQQELVRKCQESEIRITARCAFLLEIPVTSKIREIGPGSSVQYLHRTVREFLEEGPRWTAMVGYAKNSLFDPYVSLMRSSTFIIRRLVYFTPTITMESQHDTLKLEVSKAITFASCRHTSAVSQYANKASG